jgi:integrase
LISVEARAIILTGLLVTALWAVDDSRNIRAWQEGHAMPQFSNASTWSLAPEKIVLKPDLQRVLAAAKEMDAWFYVFLATAINTGLRMCEVLHIRREDLLDNRLRVTRRKKKALKPEIIEVVPPLWALLSEWGRTFDSGWMFPGACGPCDIEHSNGERTRVCGGAHASKRTVQVKWRALLTGLGLYVKGRGIHTTRHYSITEFYAKYRDLRAAQMFAGHSSSTTTERYAKVLDMREKVHGMEATL